MWDGLVMLLVLGGIMAVASFLAGSLPLFFSLTPRQMRLISAIGTGLLVGTALIVIIPEGIETLYSAETAPHATVQQAPMRGAGAALALHKHEKAVAALGDTREFLQYTQPVVARTVRTSTERAADHDHEKEQTSSHAWIGITLITGFIMMYLIDALPSLSISSRGQHIPLNTLNSDGPSPVTPTTPLQPHTDSHTHSTTIGLVIHSFADGIALGASSATPSTQSSLGLVVFVAILVHKAPAAFGLTSVLLKQGLSKRAARGHLLLFSLAAPLGALVTWAFVNALGVTGSSPNGTWWTGIVLIFSGGTFLYVAMHAMQTVTTPHYSDVEDVEDYNDAAMLTPYTPLQVQKSGGLEIGLMVLGMLLPLLTQIGHAHAHGV